MAGQPLSTLGANDNYVFSTDALPSRPDLMVAAMQVIVAWSYVQTQLGHAFGTLIGAKKPVTMSMYAAFDSFVVQRQMLITAATEILPKRYSEVFRATLIVLERAAKERHRFAHWMWGTTTDPKFSTKVLLLADPRDWWKVRVARYRHSRRFKGDPVQAIITRPYLDQKRILAYNLDDLAGVLAQMEKAWSYATALDQLAGATSVGRRELYRRLVAQPEIRQALDKERPKKTRSKKVPPRRRRVSPRARREAALARRRRAEGKD